jgi:asparagine synthase (glutamine-hydrolysing)
MVADVPVGLFLSGGIDSSLVATLLAKRAGLKLRTFTIGYSEAEFDESSYARTVAQALDTEHTVRTVSGNESLEIADELPELFDEPVGDSSAIPSLMVARLARSSVTVALSADGADEFFGGYPRYDVCAKFLNRRAKWGAGAYWLSAALLERLPSASIRAAYSLLTRGGPKYAALGDKLRKFVRMTKASDDFGAYEAAVSEWDTVSVDRLVTTSGAPRTAAREMFEAVRSEDPRYRMMHFDAVRYLPGDLLTKVDRTSMSVGLEAREPFLDQRVLALGAALPMRWRIRDKRGKYVLRRILDRYLPKGFFDRPKQGFSVPIADWLRGPLRQRLLEETSAASVRRLGLLDPSAVERGVNSFLRSERNVSAAGIWHLYQVQTWGRRWAEGGNTAP